jgi:uncharacterized protein YggE
VTHEGAVLSSGGVLHLSVRGEARQTVAPDRAEVATRVVAAEPTKLRAVTAAAALLDGLTHDLGALGGEPLRVETGGSALTWSAHSMTTHMERDHNPDTGRFEPTGMVVASVNVNVAVRDFALLEGLGAVFANREGVFVDGVGWYVDDDNPAWAAVRTAAINAVVRKGRDYAGALSSSLTSIEHIADAGLLGESGPGEPMYGAASRILASAGSAVGDGDSPSLDPLPQEVAAVIEARLSATPVSFI